MYHKTGLCEAVKFLRVPVLSEGGKGMLGQTKIRAEAQNTILIGVCNGTEMAVEPLIMFRPMCPLSFNSPAAEKHLYLPLI